MHKVFINRLFVAVLTADSLDDAKDRFKLEQASLENDPAFQQLFSAGAAK